MTFTYAISAFAVLLAYTVKGITGFANTLVFSTVMSFFTNNLSITPVEIILGTGPNVFIALRERRGFKWRVVVPLSALMMLGCVPGALFLKSGDPALIKTFFGVGITLVAVQTLVMEKMRVTPSKPLLIFIGLISGLMCGMYGIGALLVAYVSRTTDTPAEFRANVCFVFILVDIFRASLYLATGIFTAEVLRTVVTLVPFMLLGLFIGTKLAGVLPAAFVRKAVMALLALSGISLVATNVLGLI
jgi:uncharacterized membrane protein YfcA